MGEKLALPEAFATAGARKAIPVLVLLFTITPGGYGNFILRAPSTTFKHDQAGDHSSAIQNGSKLYCAPHKRVNE